MKKIAIISAGVLPLPAVNGGAVESLVNFLLNENEINNEVEITVFSIHSVPAVEKAINYKNTKFEFIRKNGIVEKTSVITSKLLKKMFNIKIDLNNFYIHKVCKIIKKNDFDYVIIENRVEYVIAIKKVTDAKIFLHIHNDYLNADTKNGKNIIEESYKIITVSEYIKNRVLTLGQEYQDKVSVLPNCTDTNEFNKILYHDFRRSFREKNNIGENDVVIMYSGRIHPTKGIKELLIAFSKIRSNNSKLLVVGSTWYGNNNKDSFTKEIEKLSYELHNKIIFTGFINFVEMPKIHAVADVAVVPSIWEEPAGLVVIEAMASGLPLITTDSGGILEYVNDKAVVVVKRDGELIKNLSYSMEKLINDEKIRVSMGVSAREHVMQYDKKQYYKKFIDILGIKNDR